MFGAACLLTLLGLSVFAQEAGAQTPDRVIDRLLDIAEADRDGEVRIVDRYLQTAEGTLMGATESVVRVRTASGEHEIPVADIAVIQRRGDPVWDGFAKGAFFGGLAGYAFFTEGCSPEDQRRDCRDQAETRLQEALTGAIVFGFYGLLFDWLRTGWTTVYRASDATGPESSRHSRRDVALHVEASPGRAVALLSVGFQP